MLLEVRDKLCDEMEKALDELGEYEGDVALALEKLGITGIPEDDECCPVANRVKQLVPMLDPKRGDWVSVSGATITVKLDREYLHPKMPAGVSDFVRAFDGGGYPQLRRFLNG